MGVWCISVIVHNKQNTHVHLWNCSLERFYFSDGVLLNHAVTVWELSVFTM